MTRKFALLLTVLGLASTFVPRAICASEEDDLEREVPFAGYDEDDVVTSTIEETTTSTIYSIQLPTFTVRRFWFSFFG